ncbi:protein kinase domain-containing protein [Rickettsiella endosymbiont of Rhagonycha lignosa]|jgi:serine/threonine protein kinase|uniref:protein kinase domain-containing protein n=1 Tax=Rickettsiella endosymbiont of Rhagonycha lignosa TaxID=3077937 RepID=UPI00313A7A25
MKLSTHVCKQLFPEQIVEKISHLASGRMGCVYKVTLNNGEILCVKILTLGHTTRLQDCNGWKLAYEDLGFNFKTGKDNQYFYFTIPYFEGQLFHYATEYNLKLRFEIIQSLIKAITDIHRKGLIHRDLTCNNIILDKEEKNKVHIIDFGRSVNAFNLYISSSDTDYIDNLQLSGQSTTISNIRRIFQPYTAPEHFRKHYNNNSTIGFRSDYYSIAQLFRFLIPEYSYLADEIIHTEGIDRNAAFAEFSDRIDDILTKNKNNPTFNESNNSYCKDLRAVYKRIIFFVREILHRLFSLTFQSPDSSPKKNRCNKHQTSVFFKLDKPNSLDTNFASSLPRNAMLYR